MDLVKRQLAWWCVEGLHVATTSKHSERRHYLPETPPDWDTLIASTYVIPQTLLALIMCVTGVVLTQNIFRIICGSGTWGCWVIVILLRPTTK